MSSKEKHTSHPDKQIHVGILLIGLALLFITQFWWPGIMFVIGAAMLGYTIRAGDNWRDNREARIMIVIGLIFWVPDQLSLGWMAALPLVLIAVGLFIVLDGPAYLRPDKRKNSELS